MELHELVGLLATIVITVCYVPQIRHTYKTKDVSGISLGMYCSLALGVSLWLLYGILTSDAFLIICNALCLIMILGILTMKILYSKRSVSELLAADVDHIVHPNDS